jgi:hypothetical protein
MKIVGTVAELSRRERRVFGCGPEEFVAKLACDQVLSGLERRQEQLAARQSAMDMYAGFGTASEAFFLGRDRAVAEHVAGIVLVYETEVHFGIPHEPAIRPDHL